MKFGRNILHVNTRRLTRRISDLASKFQDGGHDVISCRISAAIWWMHTKCLPLAHTAAFGGKTVGDDLTLFLTVSLTLNVTVTGLGRLPRFCRVWHYLIHSTFVLVLCSCYKLCNVWQSVQVSREYGRPQNRIFWDTLFSLYVYVMFSHDSQTWNRAPQTQGNGFELNVTTTWEQSYNSNIIT